MNNKTANKKLQSQLRKLCKDCEIKNYYAGKCPCANKLECDDYNLCIAKTVLTQYPSSDLRQIPASAYSNGLLAHQYVGEHVHYSCVEYSYLPVDFFIKGLRAHGYSGELRKTRIVTI